MYTMKISEKEAYLLDLILEKTIELRLPINCYDLKNELLEIEKDESEHENEFTRLIKKLEGVATPTFSDKLPNFVEKNDETKLFIKNGGFKKLYKEGLDKLENESIEVKSKTIIHAKQVIINEQSNYGNQSLSDNAIASPTTQKT